MEDGNRWKVCHYTWYNSYANSYQRSPRQLKVPEWPHVEIQNHPWPSWSGHLAGQVSPRSEGKTFKCLGANFELFIYGHYKIAWNQITLKMIHKPESSALSIINPIKYQFSTNLHIIWERAIQFSPGSNNICVVVLSRAEEASGATIVDTRHHLLHLKVKTGFKKFLKTGRLMYLPIPLSSNLDIDSAASLQH